MHLQNILSFIDYEIVSGSPEVEISDVWFDSRKVSGTSVFVARKGDIVDGHSFIGNVLEQGIAAVVAQEFTEAHISLAKEKNICLVKVEDSLYAGGILVAASFDFPATKMTMIGVTGTDGKTTTSNLIYHAIKAAGKKVGMVSTLSARIFDGSDEKENDTGFHVTTPDVEDVQHYLAEMVHSGCEYAVIECTSHAFAQERLAGINFDVGVVTNITHEHLDYHKTLERYILAKSLLFRIDPVVEKVAAEFPNTTTTRYAIINQDDHAWEYLLPYTEKWNRIGYGYNDFAQFHLVTEEQLADGISFIVQKENASGNPVEQLTVKLPLFGKYNILNATAAIAALSVLGFNDTFTAAHFEDFTGLPGRFERFVTDSHGTVIVDFAHTPHALEEVLKLGRALVSGKVVVVFGCAGLRDVEKRYLMGEIAGEFADVSIITAEDPRTETLDDIDARIIQGLSDAGAEEYPMEKLAQFESPVVRKSLADHFPFYVRIDDRKRAIENAICIADPQDIVLICGKGHEKSMNYGKGEEPWSDQEVVREVIKKLEV